jgi:hypothetical protein
MQRQMAKLILLRNRQFKTGPFASERQFFYIRAHVSERKMRAYARAQQIDTFAALVARTIAAAKLKISVFCADTCFSRTLIRCFGSNLPLNEHVGRGGAGGYQPAAA